MSAVNTKGSKRLRRCGEMITLRTRNGALRRLLRTWKASVRKKRFSCGITAFLNRTKWLHMARGLVARRRLIASLSSVCDAVFRVPFSGRWRQLRRVFHAWWRGFRPKHGAKECFNAWRVVSATKTMGRLQYSATKMKECMDQYEGTIEQYGAQAKQSMDDYAQALQHLDSTRKMLQDEIDVSQKWSNTCAEFQGKTMELEGERLRLSTTIIQLEETVAGLRSDHERKQKRCAICNRESIRFLKGDAASTTPRSTLRQSDRQSTHRASSQRPLTSRSSVHRSSTAPKH